jgi:hypothetical protein
MTNEEVQKLRVGDRILFRAITRWSGSLVWRVVKKINQPREDPYRSHLGRYRDATVEVRYGGWGNFKVYADEIEDVEPREAN